MKPARALPFLGGMTDARFMREYWQRKPLLVRNAYPPGWIAKQEVFALAAQDDAEARLIRSARSGWKVSFGPQDALPRQSRDWTLLVQGVNLHHRAAAALLRQVDFLPFWRVDDVMLSFAAPGGSVGAHVDSYDVFLLQVEGHRRWRISQQEDLHLVPGLPLKILKDFRPEEEWLLGPGDMLYLPPHVAHEGVAVDACLTASLGFRAPSYEELDREFLHHVADARRSDERYGDRGRQPSEEPAALDDHLIEASLKRVQKLRFDRADVIDFLGTYLSEPKPTVFFDAPSPPRNHERAIQNMRARGVRLSDRTIFLYRDRRFFINGESLGATGRERVLLKALANQRGLSAEKLREASICLLDQLFDWLLAGWIIEEEAHE